MASENFLDAIDPDDNLFNELFPNSDQSVSSKYYSTEAFNNLQLDNHFNLTLINYNVRSFSKNGLVFTTWLQSLTCIPKLIVLTETWNTIDSNQLCTIDGYSSIHTNRQTPVGGRGGPGGGVSILFKTNLNGEKIERLSFCNETIESCVLELKYDSNVVVLIGIYRPHTDSVSNFLAALEGIVMDSVVRNATHIFIAGDFNINVCDQPSTDAENYSNLLYSLNFLPIITRPTRFANNSVSVSSSNLDHIWTNKLSNFLSGIVLLDITDHLPCFYSLNLNLFSSNLSKIIIKTRPYSNSNLERLKNELSNTNWDLICNLSETPFDVHYSCKNFTNHLDTLYQKYFPLKTKHISEKRKNNPWLNADLKKLINKKSEAYKKFKLGLISREENNSIRNRVNILTRKAKNDYFKNCFSAARSDMRKNWGFIRSLMGVKLKTKKIENITVDNNEYNNPADIAEQFNEYFSSIATNLADKLPPSSDQFHQISGTSIQNSFYLTEISLHECLKLILNLKNTKTNMNLMPVKIFKQISEHVVSPLCSIINQSFRQGVFPNHLKIARITPIFKKGNKTDPGNYRPIASLPYISKIFERAMADRLISFFEKYNILSPAQFGFRPGKSTADALIRMTNLIYEALNDMTNLINIQIDLRKAFDVVDHAALMCKLFFYGIRGAQLEFFKSYLSGRQQYVGVNDKISSLKPISIGVPQGSILGPILFLVFINDMPNCSNRFTPTLFADDSTFSFECRNYQENIPIINSELAKINDWTNQNRLTINVPKTEMMCFSKKKLNLSNDHIMLNNEFIKFSNSCIFLGVHIDKNLTFKNHISHVMGKLAKNTGILYKIKDNMTEAAMLNYYNALLLPYMSYNVIVWGGTYRTHLEPIVVQQKRIIRIIANSHFLEHTNNLFFRLKLLKFHDVYRYFLSIYMFKTVNQGNYTIQHGVNTRNRDLAQPVYQRLTITQHSIQYCGPKIWNELPRDIRNISKLHIFKKHLKQHLLNQYA